MTRTQDNYDRTLWPIRRSVHSRASTLPPTRQGMIRPLVRGSAGRQNAAASVLYIANALFYHRRWPDPYPSVFGYHEAVHVDVCVAASCQYTAIARLAG